MTTQPIFSVCVSLFHFQLSRCLNAPVLSKLDVLRKKSDNSRHGFLPLYTHAMPNNIYLMIIIPKVATGTKHDKNKPSKNNNNETIIIVHIGWKNTTAFTICMKIHKKKNAHAHTANERSIIFFFYVRACVLKLTLHYILTLVLLNVRRWKPAVYKYQWHRCNLICVQIFLK